MLSFSPPMDKRLQRLRALGATLSAPRKRMASARQNLRATLLTIFVFVPLMTLIAILTVVALVLLSYLLMFFIMIAMVPTVILYALLFAV